MKIRRLAPFVAALPLAFYAYACSSDESPAEETPDSGTPPIPTTNPTTEPPADSGGPGTDSGADGGDGGLPACVGNPLLAAGAATPDGGATLDASVATQIVNEPTATGLGTTFVDGPQFVDFDAGGALVFSELYTNPPTLVRVTADGGARAVIRQTASQNLLPIGNAFRNNYIVTTAAAANNGQVPNVAILQTLPDGGTGANVPVGQGTNANDLVVLANGTIFFTDPQYQLGGTSGIYRVLTDGGVSRPFQDLPRPNGIALSPDEKKLYVAMGPLQGDVNSATTKAIRAYNIDAAGTLTDAPSNPLVPAAQLADTPDGIATDVGGNIWVAEAATGGGQSGRVEVFSATGQKLGTIPLPTQRPTGVAFGGPENKTLFVTVERGVYVFTSRCSGVR